MKTLYLLRHAKSDWANPNLADIDRPLSERGVKASELLGKLFVAKGIEPDLILCSPSRRTRQTLSLIAEVTGKDYNTNFDKGLYEASALHLLKAIHHLPDTAKTAMIIGHNPGLETLAHELMRPSTPEALIHLHEKFPAGGLATLTFHSPHWRQIGPSEGDLIDFVTPRELK